MNYKEIEALVKLLSDDDSFVLDQVEGKLWDYFDKVPPSVWSQFYNNAPEKSRKRLLGLFEAFNREEVIALAGKWLENPNLLSEGLYFVARLFNPFLDYQEFLAMIYKLSYYFPEDFPKNYTYREIASFISRLFFKTLEFKWEHQPPFIRTLNPEYVLRNLRGSHITLALIMVALLQHFGIYWVVLSDMSLIHTYIVAPANPKKGLYFFIDPRTGYIISESQLAKKDVETLIKTSEKHYNLLSIKSLVVAYLRENVLPRERDDDWYVLNQINSMIASYGKKIK